MVSEIESTNIWAFSFVPIFIPQRLDKKMFHCCGFYRFPFKGRRWWPVCCGTAHFPRCDFSIVVRSDAKSVFFTTARSLMWHKYVIGELGFEITFGSQLVHCIVASALTFAIQCLRRLRAVFVCLVCSVRIMSHDQPSLCFVWVLSKRIAVYGGDAFLWYMVLIFFFFSVAVPRNDGYCGVGDSQLSREYELLKREYESALQKLNSTMSSIKTFWSPELKRERQLRKEESAKVAALQRQISHGNVRLCNFTLSCFSFSLRKRVCLGNMGSKAIFFLREITMAKDKCTGLTPNVKTNVFGEAETSMITFVWWLLKTFFRKAERRGFMSFCGQCFHWLPAESEPDQESWI